jgi:uncharacterized membrane protein
MVLASAAQTQVGAVSNVHALPYNRTTRVVGGKLAMITGDESPLQDDEPPKPFIVPHRQVEPSAVFEWLALGWQDFRRAPRVSLTYGLMIFAVSALMAWVTYRLGGYVLLISALSGFVFIAPLLAFALYSVSRQLAEGRVPSLCNTLRAMRAPAGNAMVLALILLVVFLVWTRAGVMVHVFFPLEGHPSGIDIVTFLAIGSAVGAIFAAFTFAAIATSLPMLANRDVDVVTAVVSSVNAVLRNKPAMALWAASIVALTLIGFATLLVGLIVIIPWLAYATWHSYRAMLDVSDWPALNSPADKSTTAE